MKLLKLKMVCTLIKNKQFEYLNDIFLLTNK